MEAKENPEDKLFIFNVTMQNHGGYEGTYDNFEQEVWLTGEYEGKYPKTDQYLSLMKRSDQAFQYLVEYFSLTDQPTMIVMFGDHQPSVEDEFYDDIAGMPSLKFRRRNISCGTRPHLLYGRITACPPGIWGVSVLSTCPLRSCGGPILR